MEVSDGVEKEEGEAVSRALEGVASEECKEFSLV